MDAAAFLAATLNGNHPDKTRNAAWFIFSPLRL